MIKNTYSIKYYSVKTNEIVKTMTSFHFNFSKKEVFAIARRSLEKHNSYNNLYYFKVFKKINRTSKKISENIEKQVKPNIYLC